MKKQPERTALTRSILIATFLELSKRKPVDKITVSEISSRAGYNRSTFYQYFDDTQHLLSCIEDDLLEYIKDTVVSQIGKAHPTQLFTDLFAKIYKDKKDILVLLLGKGSYFPVRLKESLTPLFAAQMDLPLDEEETVYKLDFYLSGIISILSRWVTSSNPMSTEKYALIMQQLVEGMRKSEILPLL